MRYILAFKKGLDAFLRWFCITLFAILVALVCWQVFVRQVLNAGDPWTEVAARVVFIWHGLIGAAYVIGENDDVAIDFLVRRLPPAASKGVEVLAHAIVGFFAGWVMVYGGMRLVTSSWDDVVQLLPVSQGVLYLAIAISGGIIVLYSIIHILQTLVKPPKKPVNEEDIDISDVTEESI